MKTSNLYRVTTAIAFASIAACIPGIARAETPRTGPTAAVPDKGAMALESVSHAEFSFQGPLGDRLRNNVDHWLLAAPESNPGLLEMFRLRDRKPVPQLVPWAGEFVGKYLLSAIPAQRMTGDKRTREYAERVIAALINTQAEDGYLGPFPQAERLRGNWDLWGHYHIMLALLMWHQETGDARAVEAANRVADLVCKTYLDTDRRVIDAGSHEMNMAIVHSLGALYRLTGRPDYLRMMREVEKDWENAGDYARAGAQGVPFYQTNRPRWESLHDLQGLVELYRITGNEDYRQAFVNLWQSIAENDRHPSGGFSTGEQAVGNPYQEGAIETCCTTAWCAMSVDMLRLTGYPRAADELELSLWNSVLGSQHPSGRWWTYNTPINGAREASAHTIVFQSRAGTPELNCCSVNAPRGLGLLSEWGILRDAQGLSVNFYGPCAMTVPLADGVPLRLTQETEYPCDGKVAMTIHVSKPSKFNLRLRIPAWSRHTLVKLNGEMALSPDLPRNGTYFAMDRSWQDGDKLEIHFDMTPRHSAGALGRSGRAALYVGPLLLAFDPHFNSIDTPDIPAIDMSQPKLEVVAAPPADMPGSFAPLRTWKVATANGESVILCDFATAGAHGGDYAAWLPAVHADPAPALLSRPFINQSVGVGPVLFVWRGLFGAEPGQVKFSLIVSRDSAAKDIVYQADGLTGEVHLMSKSLDPGDPYFWTVIANREGRQRANDFGPRPFSLDPRLPNVAEKELQLYQLGPDRLVTSSSLDGSCDADFGFMASSNGVQPVEDRHGRPGKAMHCSGEKSGILYRVAEFPGHAYTFYAWVRPGKPSDNHLQQIFSAWRAGMDDPLRVCIHGDKLFARIEAGKVFGTAGVNVRADEWIHVAAVKEGPALRLYVNGQLAQTADVPERLITSAVDIALGANPHYAGGNECLLGDLDDFAFYARAFSSEEVAKLYETSRKTSP